MFDHSAFADYLADYKREFVEVTWPNEKYKWQAVQHFQTHWDADAKNFAEMLQAALSKTGNLLVSASRYPRSMIEIAAEAHPEAVRSMFVALFDETTDFYERVAAFKEKAESVVPREADRSHYQDENTITTYLWLRYPDKYYIYKWSLARSSASVLDAPFPFKKGHYAQNLRDQLRFYDAICELLQSDSELRDLFASCLADDCYPDPQLKTLTIDFGYFVNQHSSAREGVDQDSGQRCWLLVTSPDRFSFSALEVGGIEPWSLRTEEGAKRRHPQNFARVRGGDLVIGYESSPVKQIVALGKFADSSDGVFVPFEKTEELLAPIDYREMTALPELADFTSIQGTLFELTEAQYQAVLDLIRESNPAEQHQEIPRYGKGDYLKEVFMAEEQYESLVGLLRRKKNVILQGAPGVGKTFAANRLAWSMMGEKDQNRVEFVQFHQNYSYEDFMLGYKPVDDGFKLQEGTFFRFCKRAAEEPNREFFFIIDEINRGNMSKIFGELLMLIENDYRGTVATLAYGGLTFTVPRNVHIIGMMNTADRSLATIDYALRRRFSFVEILPGFQTEGFRRYQAGLRSAVFDSLVAAVQRLNREIADDPALGRGFCIGHSYFCGQQSADEEWLRSVVNYDVVPMLAEYWFDDDSKVQNWRDQLHRALQS